MSPQERQFNQGVLLVVVSCIGILGFMSFVAEGNLQQSFVFGIVVPLGFALGIWLIRQSRFSGEQASPRGSRTPSELIHRPQDSDQQSNDAQDDV